MSDFLLLLLCCICLYLSLYCQHIGGKEEVGHYILLLIANRQQICDQPLLPSSQPLRRGPFGQESGYGRGRYSEYSRNKSTLIHSHDHFY
ncbi:hypothetical protein V8F33_006396 [Rhypophila sp. PSN 637]